MNCNGIRLNIFVGAYFIYLMASLQIVTGQQRVRNMGNELKGEQQFEINGNLYDVFKKRLENICNELSFDNEVKVIGNDASTKQSDSIKLNQKRATNDCLYEEFKRRVDKFYSDLAENAKKFGANEGKRSTVRECLYEELKKRLDKISNELALDGEKVFDRSGRSFGNAEATENQMSKTLTNGDTNIQNVLNEDIHAPMQNSLYEDHSRQLNELSNILYNRDQLLYDKRSGDVSSYQISGEKPSALMGSDGTKLEAQKDNKEPNNLKFEFYIHENDGEISNVPTIQQQTKNTLRNDNDFQIANSVYMDSKKNLVDEPDALGTDDEGEIKSVGDSRSGISAASTHGDDVVSYGTDIGSTYPQVLTKAFEMNMSPVNLSSGNLLANVAKKMNTSTLELAHKLTSMTDLDTASIKNDPKFAAVLQKFLSSTVGMDTDATPGKTAIKTSEQTEKQKPKQTAGDQVRRTKNNNTKREDSDEECDDLPDTTTTTTTTSSTLSSTTSTTVAPPPGTEDTIPAQVPANIGEILEKVLKKLENLQTDKVTTNITDKSFATDKKPDGAPCDVLGSWHSYETGIRFEIALGKGSERQLGLAEEGNKLLNIEAVECMPPKHKNILDIDWKYMGSTMKQLGGPLYIYSQHRPDNVIALFAGTCRTCGGMDTIFGSWTYLHPSKDCQDISTAIENHRDILRRYRMEIKRKQRFKDVLFEKSNYGKSQGCAEKKV